MLFGNLTGFIKNGICLAVVSVSLACAPPRTSSQPSTNHLGICSSGSPVIDDSAIDGFTRHMPVSGRKMGSEGDFAIPAGSTVLVTGANGFIGSHVCHELLQLGFNVRGTVRDTTKYAWLVETMNSACPRGEFTMVSVPDIEKEGTLDPFVEGESTCKRTRCSGLDTLTIISAYKIGGLGVSAVIHVASPVSFSPHPESVIPVSVAGALNVLKAANRSPSVKRFVLTSSSVAAALPRPDQAGIDVTADSWNTESVEIAWREAPYHPQRAWHVYAAGKVEAERAVWKFYHKDKSRRYDLVVNTGRCARPS